MALERENTAQRDARPAAAAPLSIVIGGASGLIGGALLSRWRAAGHTVLTLVRRPAAAEAEIAWHPETGQIDAARLNGVDACIHLGGAGLADARWSPERRHALRESRVSSTALLASTLARLTRPPAAFLCASAVGYYGNRAAEPLDESSPPGAGLLPDICLAWEGATQPAAKAGIRTVQMRFGVVLSSKGGALPKMLTPFRLGLGGPVGDGRQYMSWIRLADVLGAVDFLLANEHIHGPVNVTAPAPVTNAEFTRTLAAVLRRPALLPMPAFAVRAAFGEMGERLLLEGARVLPRRLQEAGYHFSDPILETALRNELAN